MIWHKSSHKFPPEIQEMVRARKDLATKRLCVPLNGILWEISYETNDHFSMDFVAKYSESDYALIKEFADLINQHGGWFSSATCQGGDSILYFEFPDEELQWTDIEKERHFANEYCAKYPGDCDLEKDRLEAAILIIKKKFGH